MTGRHPAGVEPQGVHVDDLAAMQGHQPARGADELVLVVVAAGAGIAHHLRNRKSGERAFESALQRSREPCTGRHGAQPDVVALSIRLDVKMVRSIPRVGITGSEFRAPHLLEPPQQRGRALPRRVLCQSLGQEAFDHFPVGRNGQDVGNRNREPPRRRVERRFARRRQESLLPKPVDQRVSQRLAEALERLRRQLLRDQFDQQSRGARAHAALRLRSSANIGKPSASRDAT